MLVGEGCQSSGSRSGVFRRLFACQPFVTGVIHSYLLRYLFTYLSMYFIVGIRIITFIDELQIRHAEMELNFSSIY